MIHHLLRAAILTGFALFILYLDQTGEMALYIAPKMEVYVKLSALGLYAAAIYQVYAALQKRIGNQTPSCDCEHEPSPSVFKNIIIYGLFIFPLLLGFLVPTGTLGSDIASKKGSAYLEFQQLKRMVPESMPFILSMAIWKHIQHTRRSCTANHLSVYRILNLLRR